MTKMSPFSGLEGTGRFLSARSDGKARAHATLNMSSRKMDRKKHALTGVARLGAVPQSERLLVQFLARAHAWVAGLVPR